MRSSLSILRNTNFGYSRILILNAFDGVGNILFTFDGVVNILFTFDGIVNISFTFGGVVNKSLSFITVNIACAYAATW